MYILPVEQLPSELLNFINHPKIDSMSEKVIDQDEETLTRILNHIRAITDMDFNFYKRPTLMRRIARRMGINKCASLKDYLNLIYDQPQEVQVIYREFLIGVTKFFRDSAVWETLEAKILPDLVQAKAPDRQPLKIWIAGCSTGEEVYSVAILLTEVLKRQGVQLEVKIFATDIMKESLDMAGRGIYPESIVADVSPERLKNYFIRKGDEYQIIDTVRRMVIFSQHNVLQDPPFSKMDLVICRNLLIYLQPIIQRKVMDKLHYALNLNGILLLGNSETISDHKNVLQEIDRKGKIYRNVQLARSLGGEQIYTAGVRRVSPYSATNGRRANIEHRLAEVMNETLADEIGVAGVYVDQHYDILHAVGEFRQVLALPEQDFSFNLLKMLPQNLSLAVNIALRKAARQNERILHKGGEDTPGR